MNRTFFFTLLTLSMLALHAVGAEPYTPEQIAQKTYDRYIGEDMKMRGQMELVSQSGHTRTRQFMSYRKDSGKTRKNIIRFISPKDIEGTSFLNIETEDSNKTEQHLYLPALKRTRRIVASNKGRSFVNSDFTYEDMQRHPVHAWNYQLNGMEKLRGYDVYVLTSTPKENAETQYAKVVSWIEKNQFIPLKTQFYNEQGLHYKTYEVKSIETIESIPTEIEVIMEDLTTQHKTIIKLLDIEYNTGLKDSLFTTRALER